MIQIHSWCRSEENETDEDLAETNTKKEIAQHSEKTPSLGQGHVRGERGGRAVGRVGLAKGELCEDSRSSASLMKIWRRCHKRKTYAQRSASTYLIPAPPSHLRGGPCSVAEKIRSHLEKEVGDE